VGGFASHFIFFKIFFGWGTSGGKKKILKKIKNKTIFFGWGTSGGKKKIVLFLIKTPPRWGGVKGGASPPPSIIF